MPVIAAVDQSERATTVVKRAAELAERYDAELHVVHVGDPTIDFTEVSEEALRNREDDAVHDLVESVQADAADIAKQIGRDVEGVDEFEAVGLVGDPAEVIRSYATEQNADYIVVSGRKRRALGQALFGSVSQSLLLNADRPVVSVPYDPASETT
ncbi:universal stress protein [Halobiforma nitratireducens]|uniref:Stress response protein n=1 Tax=Halobiforma nitratireducens JCM 10879 TaxID=1227454 RepID=M0M426_9EURY|nr:universal stress protein [Halobiforma nitratireducens]EMA39120.1 stress response protein [Halobiforma nitratireducens JCM 10879]